MRPPRCARIGALLPRCARIGALLPRRARIGALLPRGLAAGLALSLAACSDPPDPPPARPASGSVARWMEWRSPTDPVRGPVVRVVDTPGGPVDSVVADPDVTTFFNDRFHPLFTEASPAQASGTVQFLDGCGCALTPPLRPASPAALIAAANAVIVTPSAHACEGRVFRDACVAPPISAADDPRSGL